MNEIKTENGKTYLNHESVPVNMMQFTGENLSEIGAYLVALTVPNGDQMVENDAGKLYLCVVDSYGEVDEENPKLGDVFIIFPNKKVILYTSGEFEANFKLA